MGVNTESPASALLPFGCQKQRLNCTTASPSCKKNGDRQECLSYTLVSSVSFDFVSSSILPT